MRIETVRKEAGIVQHLQKFILSTHVTCRGEAGHGVWDRSSEAPFLNFTLERVRLLYRIRFGVLPSMVSRCYIIMPFSELGWRIFHAIMGYWWHHKNTMFFLEPRVVPRRGERNMLSWSNLFCRWVDGGNTDLRSYGSIVRYARRQLISNQNHRQIG